MKLLLSGRHVRVILSRRNLLSLLHKLDKPGSARTICHDFPHWSLTITAEDDGGHYKGCLPGVMTPDTEHFIKERNHG